MTDENLSEDNPQFRYIGAAILSSLYWFYIHPKTGAKASV